MRLRRATRGADPEGQLMPTNSHLNANLESSLRANQGPPGAEMQHSPEPDASPMPVILASQWEPRVLLVDDDEISRFAAEQLFQSLGLKVDVVSGGHEAIRISACWPYVAILMDCEMPDVDGYLAARTIRRRERLGAHTPVIAMTSHLYSVSIGSGMDGHFGKPLQLDGLRADLKRLGLLARDGVRPAEPTEMLGADTPLLEPSILEEIAPGNPTEASAMMGQFIERATRRLPELWRAANKGDVGALDELAHDLEAHAAAAGAARVAELSRSLGNAAARSATTLAAGIEPSVGQALWDTAAAIRGYADAEPASDACAVEAAESGCPEPKRGGGDQAEPGGRLRVLIADDDPLALLAIEAMIEHADGLELVGTATGVDEVVELAALERPDVVVLDWMMPGGGGPEAARRILYQRPDTRIIALTSSSGPEARGEMVSAGASRVLTKGHSAHELDRIIRQAVET